MSACRNTRLGGAQIDHVELFVPERYPAAEWYRKTLGLEVVERCEHWAEDPGGPLMISADGGKTMLALFRGKPAGSNPPIGLRRLAFRVDADSFVGWLDGAGKLGLTDASGHLLDRQSAVDHGASFSAYFGDPWGTALEVTTYEVEGLAARLSSGNSVSSAS